MIRRDVPAKAIIEKSRFKISYDHKTALFFYNSVDQRFSVFFLMRRSE